MTFRFQNDKALVKLLLNHSFTEEDSSLAKKGSQHGLKRQLSRQVFTIKPAQHTPEPVPDKTEEDIDEEDEEGSEENDDENEDEENDEDEGTKFSFLIFQPKYTVCCGYSKEPSQ